MLRRFRAAAQEIARLAYVRELAWSPVYRSEPVGPVSDQATFLNAALALEVDGGVSSTALLRDLLEIEAGLGRIRPDTVAKGPRPIDLDLLLVGDECAELEGPPSLSLPHPGICRRAFVLRPIRDLVGGDFVIPGHAQTVAECLEAAEVASQKIRVIDATLGSRASHES